VALQQPVIGDQRAEIDGEFRGGEDGHRTGAVEDLT
jgi:hypothetical protein